MRRHVWVCACLCGYPWRPELSSHLELELRGIMNHLIQVLGTKLRFSGKKQVVFLTSELSLQALLLFSKLYCDGYMKILSGLNALGISPEHTM